MRPSWLRRLYQLTVLACACFAATGCRHNSKAVSPQLPPPATVALVPAPESATPPQVQTVPVTPLPALPAQPPPKKKKRKPAVVLPVSPAPVEMASNAPPPPPVNVGALTAGEDTAPAAQQRAAASISEVERRLAGLPATTLDAQKEGVKRVRNFLRQAQDALRSGDAGGAATLAGKAKVLLEDLLK